MNFLKSFKNIKITKCGLINLFISVAWLFIWAYSFITLLDWLLIHYPRWTSIFMPMYMLVWVAIVIAVRHLLDKLIGAICGHKTG